MSGTKARNLALAAAAVDSAGNITADLIDNIDSTQFLRKDTSETISVNYVIDNTHQLHFGNSSTGIWKNTSNNFVIRNDDNEDIYIDAQDIYIRVNRPNGYESAITAAANGGVNLYYDNTSKLATTSSGIEVTNTLALRANSGSDPYSILTVADSSSSATDARFLFRNGTDTAPALRVVVNGTTGVSIDAVQANNSSVQKNVLWQVNGGNFGIRNSNPQYMLDIGNTTDYAYLNIQGANANVAANIRFKHHGGGSRTGVDRTWNISRGSDQTSFGTGVTASGSVGGLVFWNNLDGGTSIDAMRLTDAGDALFGYNVSFDGEYIKLPAQALNPSSALLGSTYFNTTDSTLRIYDGNSWGKVLFSPPGTLKNPATNATQILDYGITTNGYYYIDLGSGSPQSIYCILDGSIESGYGYMRVWDAGASGAGTTVYHFYTGETDNAAFYNAGGWDFVISEIALRTGGTWSYPNYSSSTITRYVGNGGGGLHSQYNPRTFNSIFNTGWSATGFETDNYKNFGYTNTTVTNQLYILDDNDTPCGRQINCTGTPRGVVAFGNASGAGWPDHGQNTYTRSEFVMGLYVR